VWNFFNADCTDPAITCTDPNTVRPLLGFDFINVNERAATSRYNSLQVFFNHQMSHGLAFQASYTYSRNIATTANKDSEGRASPMQDAFHPEREKAVADQDIPHSLVFNYVWQLPFFDKTKGFKKVFLRGWQVNGISVFRSGRPINVCLQGDTAGLGDSGICERPDITGNPVLPKSQRTLNQWFNTAAFSEPAPGTFGNGGRNPGSDDTPPGMQPNLRKLSSGPRCSTCGTILNTVIPAELWVTHHLGQSLASASIPERSNSGSGSNSNSSSQPAALQREDPSSGSSRSSLC